ncbi:MAG: hypothetical protein HYT87_13955 [Nitrospirae bacterium]|nr:hypothetical protein [Nitrospirota bacterium]
MLRGPADYPTLILHHWALLLFSIALCSQVASCAYFNVDDTFNRKVQIRLKTVYLHDQRFPSLPEEQLRLVFTHALLAMRDEFQSTNISFSDMNTMPIEDYFQEITGDRHNPFMSLELFGGAPDTQLSSQQRHTLELYPVDELKAAVPEGMNVTFRDYQTYYSWLLGKWVEKRDRFRSLLVDGQPIVRRDTVAYQTHTGWRFMFSLQRDYDVFITNVPVFFDSLDIPVPHGVLIPRLAQSGFANESPGAPSGAGVALMISTISFLNFPGLAYDDVSPSAVPQALGIYYLAHELGHMLFLLPEHYDHPDHCLMNTPPVNWDREKAVKTFLSHKGPCPKCRAGLTKGKRWWLRLRDYWF